VTHKGWEGKKMKATHLIKTLIILFLSIQSAILSAAPSSQASTLTAKLMVVATTTDNAVMAIETDEIDHWLITDEESHWSAYEIEVLQDVLQNTFGAVAAYKIDGRALLDGYRFRHEAGSYIGDKDGRMGTIDHNTGVITLTDKAFTVQNGFAIYHELGHAVDFRLNRQLSAGFHSYTGGTEINDEDNQWHTADNYWLREQSRDDREEAAADAFAILVMVSYAGLNPPVFANQPVAANYEAISAAAAQALQSGES
jgi:hypothetical protein